MRGTVSKLKLKHEIQGQRGLVLENPGRGIAPGEELNLDALYF